MRPIELTVAGLHSFREKQIIDFKALCDGGVFGIFGPTGSGKSSLLDAMTLALYGKVERATNNTQGILNHAEDQLHVSFTFSLRNANGSSTYMVERSFKRTGDVTLKTAVSRLIDRTDPENRIVLADKTSEVNRGVEELLGLTIDDFTRAVVLPQGKFAEFLSLKGSERRQMLQRLFNLEQYGDKLNQKIRERLQLQKAALETIAAEQAGLGDASTEALEQAKTELKQAEQQLQEKEDLLKKAEAAFEVHKQLWEWQDQKRTAAEQLEKLKQVEIEITLLQEKGQRANIAERLIPNLDEVAKAQAEVIKWQTENEKAVQVLANAKEQFVIIEEQYKAANEKRKSEEPVLLVKQEKLKHALEMQLEMSDYAKKIAEIGAELEKLKSEHQEKNTEYAVLKDKFERGQKKQQTMKEQQDLLAVDPDEREQLRLAGEQKQAYVQLLERHKELSMDFTKKETQWNEVQQKLENTDQDINKAIERTIESFIAVEKLYHLVKERDQELARIINWTTRQVKSEQSALDHAREKRIAANLAIHLADGHPCPVCGSEHHPNPTVPNEADEMGTMKARIEQLEDMLQQMRQIQPTLSQYQFQLEQLSATIAELIPRQISQLDEHHLAMIEAVAGIEETEAGTDELLHAGQLILLEVKRLHQDVLEQKESSRRVTEQLRGFQDLRKKLESEQKPLQQDLNEYRSRLTALNEQLDQAKANWSNTLPTIQLELVEKHQAEMARKDRELAAVLESLRKSVTILEDWDKQLVGMKETINNLEVSRAGKLAEWQQLKERHQSIANKLSEQTGGEDAGDLLKAVDKTLSVIRESEEQAARLLEQAKIALTEAEKRSEATSYSLGQARRLLEERQAKWEELIKESPFATSDEVRAAVTPKHIQEEWQQKIDHYFDEVKRWTNELNAIMTKISGRTLSEAEWQETVNGRQSARQAVNEALEAKGRAAKTVTDITKKHERFIELEQKREQTAHLAEKLGKLQAVFKGNAFVEFIAEEQLIQVSQLASERLSQLTRGRYAIEVDSSGGFIIRDDANGGVRRPVTTLSGGETFLTSLALALSLSAQIQLRGEYPLEFFFLDEGFGTLDQELLDTVITALEKLHSDSLSVGVISHVQEMRERLPRRLVVYPAEPSGRGSRVDLETI